MQQLDSGLIQTLVNVAGKAPRQTQWVRPYSGEGPSTTNQFVVFLKPEAFASGARVGDILKLLAGTLATFHVEVGAVRLLTADYLARHQIMDRHYGVINV